MVGLINLELYIILLKVYRRTPDIAECLQDTVKETVSEETFLKKTVSEEISGLGEGEEELVEQDSVEESSTIETESNSTDISEAISNNSIIIFLHELDKVKLLCNEYIVNYQYYDGEYAWIMIVTIDRIKDVETKYNKQIIGSNLTDESKKIIRLTKIRDKKYSEEFGFNVNEFQYLFDDYIKHKKEPTYTYLLEMNFIDEKHLGLYSKGSEDVNDNVDLDTNTTETITNIQELILKELPDNLYTDAYIVRMVIVMKD